MRFLLLGLGWLLANLSYISYRFDVLEVVNREFDFESTMFLLMAVLFAYLFQKEKN